MLRNGEVKISAAIFAVLFAVGAAAGFSTSLFSGFLALGLCAACAALYYGTLASRYRHMKKLAQSIDRVLHGHEDLDIVSYREGELSILQNELSKLLTRLREQADLLEKEKMQMVDFIADISHQIRTPLTSAGLMLENLHSAAGPEESARQIKEIEKQLVRVQTLVSALLKLARLDAGAIVFKKEPVAFDELIDKVMEPFAILMELKGQTLQKQTEGSFNGDFMWTCEALGNMVKNCIDHMDAGTLTIRARENPLFSEIVLRDSGPGIDQRDLPRLFDRFYRGQGAAPESIGIGLALAKKIITSQNGTVKAENHKDGGAMFTVRFYKSVI